MKLKISLLYVMLAFTGQLLNAQEEVKTSKKSYSWQPFATSGVTTERAVSFRLQAGMMKKWGFYVAGKTNFRFERPYEIGYTFK